MQIRLFGWRRGGRGGLQFCLLLFTAPHLEFAVERAHGVNKEKQEDRILRAVQVANAPGNRDDRQVNQIRVERRSANLADDTYAEESSHEALTRKERDQEQPVQHNRERMVEEIVEAGVQFRTHQEKAPVNSSEHQELRGTAHESPFQEIEMTFLEESEKHHAKQVFKNSHRRKNVEKAVLGIKAIKPEVVG